MKAFFKESMYFLFIYVFNKRYVSAIQNKATVQLARICFIGHRAANLHHFHAAPGENLDTAVVYWKAYTDRMQGSVAA
jgi:hypothetical protein